MEELGRRNYTHQNIIYMNKQNIHLYIPRENGRKGFVTRSQKSPPKTIN